MHRFAIGLGGNLGNTSAIIQKALHQLEAHAKIEKVTPSGDYRTPAWGRRKQRDFINRCAVIETSLTPIPFLKLLQRLERRFGRIRRQRWGARTLDLDILWWSEGRVQTRCLTIPHPRMTRRAFVLKPLADVLPDALIASQSVQDHLTALPKRERQHVRLVSLHSR